jgi:ABC-2 type transport system ATP-binding protein
MYVQIDARGQDASAVLGALPGVTGVSVADTHDGYTGYEVDSEAGHDIRRDLARAIVSQNWGLLELRPTRMSLEDIFLSLTTEEKESAEPASGAEQHG